MEEDPLKKKEKFFYRAFNCSLPTTFQKNNLLDFLCSTSKFIYNSTIYHTIIYRRYKYDILNKVKDILDNENPNFYNRQFDEDPKKNINLRREHVSQIILSIFDDYITSENIKSNQRKNNYPLIEKFISHKLKFLKFEVNNSNFGTLHKFFKKDCFKIPDLIFDEQTKYDTVTYLIFQILYKFYIAKYHLLKTKIIRKKLTKSDKILNKKFITHIENKEQIPYIYNWSTAEKFTFEDNTIKISDQTIVQRKVYQVCKECKMLASDLSVNIIRKANDAFKSYLGKRKTTPFGCHKPGFLKEGSKYGLYCYLNFMKIMVTDNSYYYQIPIGTYASKNYQKIVDSRMIKLNNDYYVNSKKLDKLNFIINTNPDDKFLNSHLEYEGKYISKKDSDVIIKYSGETINSDLIKLNDNDKYNFYTYPNNPRFFSNEKPLKKFLNTHFKYKGKYISKNDTSIINGFYLFIPVHDNILPNICYLEIYPTGETYNVTFNYKVKPPKEKKNKNYASGDLGVRRLIALFSLNADPIIIPGGPCKSINHYYNKIIDKAKKEAKRKKIDKSFKIQRMYKLKDNKMKSYFHKVTNYIINEYCKVNDISLLIIGYNKGWKDKTNMGRKNNRDFQEIPYAKLLKMLENKGQLKGIKIERQEEAFTSKCDALAEEEIRRHDEGYLGRRIKGKFKSSTTKVILNADINGAMNIMRKYNNRMIEEKGIKSDMKIEKRIKESLKEINIFRPTKVLLKEKLKWKPKILLEKYENKKSKRKVVRKHKKRELYTNRKVTIKEVTFNTADI